MAIYGEVEAFSLVDLFELLSQGDETGTVEITHKERGETAVLRLLGGRLLFTGEEHDAIRRLGDILVAQGALTSTQLERGLELQADLGGLLGDVLIADGLTSAAAIGKALAAQWHEGVYDLFLWRGARYRFQRVQHDPELARAVASGEATTIDPTRLLLEASRRVDEWRLMQATIPSRRSFYVEVRHAFGEIDKVLAEAGIDPNALRFDGRSNLHAVLAAWNKPAFEAHQIVYRLLYDGLIEPVPLYRMETLVVTCLEGGERAQGLRLYEAILETHGDSALDLDDFVFAQPDEHATEALAGAPSAETTGRRAAHVALSWILSGKCGRLALSSGNNARVVTIDEESMRLETRGESLTPKLSHYVRKRGGLSDKELREARIRAKQDRVPVEAALLQSGLMQRDVWGRVISDKLVDELLEVSLWERARVHVDRDPQNERALEGAKVYPRVRFKRSFVETLTKRARRARELIAAFGSANTVLFMRDDLDRPVHEMYELFDGRRTIADIAREVHGSRFNVLRAIFEGLDKRILRHLTPEEVKSGYRAAMEEREFQTAANLCASAVHHRIVPRDPFAKMKSVAERKAAESKLAILKADFRTFGPAELLQSLHKSKQSGTLEISDQDRTEVIYFHRGNLFVLEASEDTSDFAQDFLGAEAIDLFSGAFDEDSLTERGFMSEYDVSDAQVEAIKEKLWDLLRWENARFRYTRNQLPKAFFEDDPSITKVSLQTESFLLETIRHVQEWEELRAAFPDVTAVFRFEGTDKKMRALATAGADAGLLYLLDGTKAIEDLAAISNVDVMDVLRVLYPLREAGAIVPVVEQIDPVQTDPVQADPVQADPVQADPAQAEPAQAEPVQTDPAQTNPA